MVNIEDLIIEKENLTNELVKLVNDSNLPPFIVRPILEDMLKETIICETQQLNKARQMKEERKHKEGNNEKNRENNS